MSSGKRKQGPLDTFITVTKKPFVSPTSPEQTEHDQSEILSLDVTQSVRDEPEETEPDESSNLNENFHIFDSRPDTHEIDIGFQLSLKVSLSDKTKYQLLTTPFRPDKKYTFPSQYGKNGTVRRFMTTWLIQHPCLSYSPYYEGAFCVACSLFSPLISKESTTIFVNYPCSKFRHLKHFSTLIKTHINSENHKIATSRAINFTHTFENPSSSIDYQLDRNRLEIIKKNKSILLSIIKVVITCARQNIALRGHRGEDILSIREHIDVVEMSSGSNFISLLKQRIDAGDHILQYHLEKGPRNSTYTSSSTQNEIIEIIYEHILSSILGRVGPTTVYSIIVDGTTDSSNIEQLCLLIRYVDSHSNEIREDFLGFVPTTSSTAESIANHILSCLKRFKLSLNNCIGQSYDGAPNMSGVFNGCQAIIKRVCPDADYMHCSSHALNLALMDSCTSHFIRNTFGVIKSTINFFNDSPKRSNALKNEIERPDNDYLILTKKKRLLTLCETRWVERNVAIETFLELYVPISNTLDFLRTQGDASSQQLYHPVTSFETIVCTCIASFLLSEITPLSRLLQTPTIDFGVAHNHVLALIKTLDTREIGASEYFKNVVFEQAKEIANELFVQPAVPRSYQRRNGQDIIDAQDFYREKVFLPVLRELKGNVEQRLSVFSHSRIQLLTQLRPERITAATYSTAELYKNLKTQFLDRLPQPLQLYGEIERWKIECSDLLKKPNYDNLWMNDLLTHCDPILFPNINFLLLFLATLPVTTSSAERAFSSLKRIKTYCRSTMIEDRLNGLAAAFIHKNVEIDAEKILDLFVEKHQRRFDFGL